MSKFTFVLPDGQIFELTGTADTTRAQAEKIFNEQLAAGAFVGLRKGDTIQSPISQLIKFSLGRLDRGTAGVNDLPLVAINNLGVISAMPVLSNVPVNNPINTSDFIAQTPVLQGVGPLTPAQVQALMAAAAQNPGDGVGKYGFTIPQLEAAGVVKPGTGCRYAGIANTPSAQSQPSPSNLMSVLSSPNVYTGQYNISSLDDLLSNETTQDRIQENLIRSSYNTLVYTGEIQTNATTNTPPVGSVYTGTGVNNLSTALAIGTTVVGALSTINFAAVGNSISSVVNGFGKGIDSIASKIGNINFDSFSTAGVGSLSLDKITGSVSNLANRGVAELGGLLNNATRFGVDTATQWAKGFTPDGLTSQLNGLAKQGQFSINFADFKLPTTVAGFAPAAAFVGTTNRQTVDLATAKIIGSSKIPTPSFGGTSIDSSLGGLGSQLGSLNPVAFGNKLGSLNIASVTAGINPVGMLNSTNMNSSTLKLGQTITGTNGLPTQVGGIVSGIDTTNASGAPNVAAPEINFAARQAAISDVELKQGIYEVAKAEHGITSLQAQEAFAAYKAALARLDNFA